MNKSIESARLIYLTENPPSTKAKTLLNTIWEKPIERFPNLQSVYAQNSKEPMIVLTADKFLFIQEGLNTYEAHPIEGLPFLLKRFTEGGRH